MISPYVFAGLQNNEETDDYIVSLICDYCGITREHFFRKKRSANLVRARKYYCFIQRVLLGKTHKPICKMLNTHHATTIHHVNKFTGELQVYSDEYNNFKTFVGSINHKWALILESKIKRHDTGRN